MAPHVANKPNILFFHVDNVSVGDFGCYGGAYPIGAKTPNVDRFARECLLLTNYNVEAQCTPSRAALMTGGIRFALDASRHYPVPDWWHGRSRSPTS
jgi:arylsulfatase